MRRLAAVLALSVLALTGCAWEGTGTVVSKRLVPEHEESGSICGAYGSNGTCSVQVPYSETIEDSWRLTVRDDEGNEHEVEVSREMHDSAEINERITIQ